MIAMALVCNPKILIADEPTTALDVTIQTEIIELLKQIQKETGMAVIMITPRSGNCGKYCKKDRCHVCGKGGRDRQQRRYFLQRQTSLYQGTSTGGSEA